MKLYGRCLLWMVMGLFLFSACGKDMPLTGKEEASEQNATEEKEEEKEGKPDAGPKETDEKPGETEAEPLLLAIEVVQTPFRDTYIVYSSEELDLAGLVVEGVYDNGERKVLSVVPDTVSGFSTASLSENLPVTVSVGGKEAVFTVRVSDAVVVGGVLERVVDTGKQIFYVPQGVKAIGQSAFFGSRFEHIVLGEGVESVGERAFADSQIRRIDFPESLNHIGAYAFMGCQRLETADLEHTEVTVVGKRAFADSGIREVRLPVSLRQIDSQAFLRTASLQHVVLPDGLLSLGFEAFRQSGVVTVVLPDGIKVVGKQAFYHCEALQTVSCSGKDAGVSDGEVQSGVFIGCPALAELTFPQSIASVGRTLFSGGSLLKLVVMQENVAHMAFNALGNASVGTLVVKAASPPSVDTYSLPAQVDRVCVQPKSVEQYQAAAGWEESCDKIRAYDKNQAGS